MDTYAVLMYADPDHTKAMTDEALFEVETATAERAHEIAARVLDDHVTAVEVRRIHSVAPKA
jgi:hypothetical protein